MGVKPSQDAGITVFHRPRSQPNQARMIRSAPSQIFPLLLGKYSGRKKEGGELPSPRPALSATTHARQRLSSLTWTPHLLVAAFNRLDRQGRASTSAGCCPEDGGGTVRTTSPAQKTSARGATGVYTPRRPAGGTPKCPLRHGRSDNRPNYFLYPQAPAVHTEVPTPAPPLSVPVTLKHWLAVAHVVAMSMGAGLPSPPHSRW